MRCRGDQESGDDEYKGDQSDTEDEVDSDFDIDEGDEPDSEQEDDEPRRKRRVVTKAYKVRALRDGAWRAAVCASKTSANTLLVSHCQMLQ